MSECQQFPDTWEEFEQLYGFTDKEEVYTNGSRLIQSFRVKQWLDHIAEPERKKGMWIEVHGYATPGGDPVWKCSECGKGIHVYGIEASSYNRDYTDGHQWVACPNCGAEMTGGDHE